MSGGTVTISSRFVCLDLANKAFQTDKVAVSHLLLRTQKLRHSNFAAEQRRYVYSRLLPDLNISQRV